MLVKFLKGPNSYKNIIQLTLLSFLLLDSNCFKTKYTYLMFSLFKALSLFWAVL